MNNCKPSISHYLAGISNHSRSPPRSVLTLGKFQFLVNNSNLMIDAHERAELEAQSKENYDHQVDELRHNGYDERKIRELTRAVILKKSVDEIKEYADYQKYVRKSPERYVHVQSKVARNLKV